MKSEKKKISLGDRASYFYIKNLKKWMFCPSCKNGKMSFNKKTSQWVGLWLWLFRGVFLG